MRKIILIYLVLFTFSGYSQAEETHTQELLHKIQQRDQVILELIERIEALERQLGVQPYKPKVSTSSEEEHDLNDQTNRTAENLENENAPGVVVVDETMTERALERSLTRDGALLLPAGILEIEPRLAYAREEDATPSFVMSGSNVLASETERNSDSLTAALLFRLGLPGDSQLEIGLPYRWRENETVTNVNFTPTQTSSQSGNGPGDVRITFAKTFLREDSGQPDLVGRFTWDTDTGKSSDNGVSLGGGFHELQGALSFIKRQDPVVFVGGISYEYTFEEASVQPGKTIAASFGSYFALNPQTSLNFTLSMAYQKETKIAGTRFEGTDRKVGTLLIGGSTLIGRGTLLNLSVGVGLTEDANDFSVSLSLPVRLDSRIF
jgi:hypothetical protein